MTMLSYAQNGEDVILNRLFPQGDGFFIDVGANDPVDHSVTKHFYDRGWRGINIEPEPAAFARMQAGRPLDINLNVGVSEKRGVLTFYDVLHANGWSTFSSGQAANLRAQGQEIVERPIPVMTLAQVCEEHAGDRVISFLKVDAESHETEVLAGADWSRYRPRAILVESMGWVHWEPGLLAAGYHFGLYDGINRFYIRDEDKALLPKCAMMANFQDDFVPYMYLKVIEHFKGELLGLQARHADLEARHGELQARNADLQRRHDQAEGQLQGLHPWSRNLHEFLRKHPRVFSAAGARSRRVG